MSAFLQQPPAPPAPVAPPAPTTPGGAFIVRGRDLASGRTMTRQDVDALQARRSELTRQLDRSTRQRREISEQLRRADGANKLGLERRITELDGRILRMESEIDEVNQQLASTDATRIASTAPPRENAPRNPFHNVDVEPIIITFTLFVLCPVALSISRLIWKRGSVRTQAAQSPESSQRLERMEQAMDAIAIEIERVSEGQRFVTRLLSERGPSALGVGQQAAEPLRVPHSDASRVR